MRFITVRSLMFGLIACGILFTTTNSFANPNLDAIRVSDYVTYTHIALELSTTKDSIVVQALPEQKKIQVRLRSASRGKFESTHFVKSEVIGTMRLSRDSTQKWLIIDIPVTANADLKRMHWHRWNHLVSIDVPTRIPNHSLVPSAEEIADFKERGGKVVVIDAGHGGHDPGTQGGRYTQHPRLQEKEMVLDLSHRLKKMIDADPQMMALLTRYDDYLPQPFGVQGDSPSQYIRESLRYRVQLAKEYMGDVYLSLHLNAIAPENQAKTRGFMIFYLGNDTANKLFEDSISDTSLKQEEMMMVSAKDNNDLSMILNGLKRDYVPQYSKELAEFIADNMRSVNGLQLHSKYLRAFPYLVLRQLNMPSVLIEFCYLTHPNEHEFVRSPSNRQNMAKAVHQGLRQYFFQGSAPMPLPAVAHPMMASIRRPIPEPDEKPDQEIKQSPANRRTTNSRIASSRSTQTPSTQVPAVQELTTQEQSVSGAPVQTLEDALLELEKKKQEAVQQESQQQLASTRNTAVDEAIQSREQANQTQPEEKKEIEENKPDIKEVPKTTTPPKEPIEYTIQSGDTFISIAKAFGCNVNDLLALNKMQSHTIIKPNQKILIPGEGTTIPDFVSPAPDYVDYTIQKGDTLGEIAQKHNTTVASIKSLNNMTSNTIQVGKSLKIHIGHKETPTITKIREYEVRKGDTLGEIATKFNVSIKELQELNDIKGSSIYPGQILKMNL